MFSGPMWQYCQSISEKRPPFTDQEPLGTEENTLRETVLASVRKKGGVSRVCGPEQSKRLGKMSHTQSWCRAEGNRDKMQLGI